MNSVFKSSLLALVVLASSNVSYALRIIHGVSTEQAIQSMGVKIGSESVATNQLSIRFEFALRGDLEQFSHAELEVAPNGRRLVYATLKPLQQTGDKVVLYFSIDPEYVRASAITIIVKRREQPDPDGYIFEMKDFIKPPNLQRGINPRQSPIVR